MTRVRYNLWLTTRGWMVDVRCSSKFTPIHCYFSTIWIFPPEAHSERRCSECCSLPLSCDVEDIKEGGDFRCSSPSVWCSFYVVALHFVPQFYLLTSLVIGDRCNDIIPDALRDQKITTLAFHWYRPVHLTALVGNLKGESSAGAFLSKYRPSTRGTTLVSIRHVSRVHYGAAAVLMQHPNILENEWW